MKLLPNIQLPASRMDSEAHVMQKLPAVLLQTPESQIRIPEVIKYDKNYNVLIMADGGEMTLKAAYGEQDMDVQLLGCRLGKWLRNLHTETREVDIGRHHHASSICG